MPTHDAVGLATQTGVSLKRNPPHTASWRDFSLDVPAPASVFAPDTPHDAPWISEHRLQFSSPDKYTSLVQGMTMVHTGGGTRVARTTHVHHEPKMATTGTAQAYQEQVQVATRIKPHLTAFLKECDGYHLHSQDGWITSAGLLVCARKAGLELTRTDFLALERSVPKDDRGRINVYHIANAIEHLAPTA